MKSNADQVVVQGFGDEWSRFDQSSLDQAELTEIFDSYFSVFPWHELPPGAVGFDLGCGSGRWAKLVALRVGNLHCIDASAEALSVAKRNLSSHQNCQFHCASVDSIPLEDGSADFGYSLGVLHHVPDTQSGIKACTAKLKPGAPFLLYLYYAFDNKPWWYKLVWQLSEGGRFLVSRLPHGLRYAVSQVIASTVYLPLARLALLAEKLKLNPNNLPLSAYRHRSFYVMRTDALDRFGTQLEQRFSRREITQMMQNAGLDNIVFSDRPAYWCAVGYKK
jgi:ubiquinone/menaquinone biosynthesis C-methylase UbiE